ncbi:hypothetical protein [Actinomadura fibrosa]|uniref:DUF320 domain-containing protein n=1 Tax=Actinomadura fibrosa TaxID=111802 RepID=A0ABW2XG49_9ACTN|nr:hypothetical protein [Actinomadura fibrosa]
MMKRLAAAGFLSLAIGGAALSATPAMAGEDPTTSQIVGVQTCRSVDIAAVIGVAIHNILGVDHEQGDCANGSTTDSGNGHANGNGSGNGWSHDHHGGGKFDKYNH